MTSLEERALRRDRRFIVRLVLMLAVGVGFGVFVFGQLTDAKAANCAAERINQQIEKNGS